MFLVPCSLFLVLCTACQSHALPKARPISQYRLISVVGLDRDEKDPSLIALTLSAKEKQDSKLGGGKQGGGAGEDNRPLLLTNEARSAALAYQQMQTYTQDYLFLGHVRYFLLGEDAAREGIARYLDYPARDPDGRFLARLYVVESVSARALLSRASTNEKYIADRLAAMESDVGVLSASKVRNLTQTLDALYGANGNFLLPLLRMEPPAAHDAAKPGEPPAADDAQKNSENQADGENASKEAPPSDEKKDASPDKDPADGQPMDLDIAGYAIFVDGRMTGVIGPALSPAVNFLQNTVDMQMTEAETADGHIAALRILHSRSELAPNWKNGRLTGLHIKIDVEAALNEKQSGRPPDGPEELKPLAGQFDRWLENSLTALLTQAQGLKTDYLGLGARLERAHPIRFSQLDDGWDVVFASLPVTVSVDTSVVRSYELD